MDWLIERDKIIALLVAMSEDDKADLATDLICSNSTPVPPAGMVELLFFAALPLSRTLEGDYKVLLRDLMFAAYNLGRQDAATN